MEFRRMGDIGGAFKMLLVVACFGLAFILAIVISAVVAIFAPVSISYALGAALIIASAAGFLVSAKVQ
jgi:hypothetical protein